MMSIELVTLLLFGSFLTLMVAGVPLVFALVSSAVVGTYFLWGPQALYAVGIRTFSSSTSFVLIAIPMFIFMGSMLEKSGIAGRSEEHTSELQSLMRISYAVFCLKKKNKI